MSSEDFFIKEIKDGAAMNGEPLTDREEKMLRSGVTDVVTSGIYSQDESKKLNDKCVRALSKSYSFATADNNIERMSNARMWKMSYEYVYRGSKNIISGVVQNWYVSQGANLEKQVIKYAHSCQFCNKKLSFLEVLLYTRHGIENCKKCYHKNKDLLDTGEG